MNMTKEDSAPPAYLELQASVHDNLPEALVDNLEAKGGGFRNTISQIDVVALTEPDTTLIGQAKPGIARTLMNKIRELQRKREEEKIKRKECECRCSHVNFC